MILLVTSHFTCFNFSRGAPCYVYMKLTAELINNLDIVVVNCAY
jgi:hypothetical protein